MSKTHPRWLRHADGERVLHTAKANRLILPVHINGRLTLTDQRLRFDSDPLERWMPDSKPVIIAMHDLRDVLVIEATSGAPVALRLFRRPILRFRTRSGDIHDLVVRHAQEWKSLTSTMLAKSLSREQS